MADIEKLTKKTIADGGVLALLYFDLHGKTKEAVQQIGTGFVNHLLQRPGVVFALGEIDEPVSGGEGKNWSSNIQIKILTKSFSELVSICIDNSPFTMEILRPDELRITLSEAHEVLSTISATAAQYKRYIISKVATPQQLAVYEEALKKRAEMGKKLLKKKKGGK